MLVGNRSHPCPVVAIVGGGPAGCAAALALASEGQYLDIHLYDAASAPSKIKIGETLPGAATPVLQRLGAFFALHDIPHLPSAGSIAVWGNDVPGFNDSWADLNGTSYHLDRIRFDSALMDAVAAAGVTVHGGTRLRRLERSGHAIALAFATRNGSEQTVAADWIIDASGVGGAVVRRLNVYRNMLDVVLSFCAVILLPDGPTIPTRTLLEATPEGWWYAARLPGGRAIISFTTDRETITDADTRDPNIWLQQFDRTLWLKDRFPPLTPGSEINIITKMAPSALLSTIVGEHWLAVGDAACSYDPLTSAGITKALLHGEAAGHALIETLLGGNPNALNTYQDQVFEDFSRYAALRRHLYELETRFTDSPFWRRRLYPPTLSSP